MTKRYITSATIQSPIGPIHLAATAKGLVHCRFVSNRKSNTARTTKTDQRNRTHPFNSSEGDSSLVGHAVLEQTQQQLREYFSGTRHDFSSLPIAPLSGTVFQRRVWKALQAVPYGSTVSYSDIAAAIHNPKAVRAVGMANNKNPISIIIPCHRVIGKDGRSMVGYNDGVDKKIALLNLESALQAPCTSEVIP